MASEHFGESLFAPAAYGEHENGVAHVGQVVGHCRTSIDLTELAAPSASSMHTLIALRMNFSGNLRIRNPIGASAP